MTSIIIPAHNEEGSIGTLLHGLVDGSRPGEFEIIVVPNGCTDRTVEIARSFAPAVTVVESPVASKAAAIDLGDRTATSFPRLFLDADIRVGIDAVRRVAEVLSSGEVKVAAPEMRVRLDRSSWWVRAYYGIWMQLPYHRDENVGGFYGLSEEARRSFDRWPDVVPDDFFARSLAQPPQRRVMRDVSFEVMAPSTFPALVNVMTRAHAGNMRHRDLFPEEQDRVHSGHVRGLVQLAKKPACWPQLAVYVTATGFIKVRARLLNRRPDATKWLRDNTTRAPAA